MFGQFMCHNFIFLAQLIWSWLLGIKTLGPDLRDACLLVQCILMDLSDIVGKLENDQFMAYYLMPACSSLDM